MASHVHLMEHNADNESKGAHSAALLSLCQRLHFPQLLEVFH